MTASPADYGELQSVLARAGSMTSAADAHGSLSGVLCGAGSRLTPVWIEEVLQDVDPENAQRLAAADSLRDLELQVWAELAGSAMQFEPLLPVDDAPLEERVLALTDWCRGFLYGLSLSGLVEDRFRGTDVEEIIHRA